MRKKEPRWWVAPLVLYICMALAALVGLHLVSSCSAPKYVERVVVEYRDRVVHDTATVEVPVEVPAKLSYWQRLRMQTGDIALIALALLLGWGAFRLWRRIN